MNNTIKQQIYTKYYFYYKILILSCLSFIILSLNACQSENNHNKVHDKHFWMKAHASSGEEPVSWKSAYTQFEAYFGQYHSFADHFQPYYGDPIGPITGLWKVTRYLGKKPTLLDCGKEPEFPDRKDNQEEYDSLIKIWEDKTVKLRECWHKNTQIKQDTEHHTYFFARSPNNYQPTIPPRGKRHALYEAHISFGSVGEIPEYALRPEHKKIKDQLFSDACWRFPDDITCYQLPGKKHNLYYTVRSNLLKARVQNGVVSTHLAIPDYIYESQQKWHEIKGIEITQQQYAYLKERCTYPLDCFIDNDMPNLTPALKAYQKATAWDLDNNQAAMDAFIKKAEGYQAHPKQDQKREVIPTEKERNPF